MIEQSGKKWGIDNINRLSETQKTYISVRDLITNGYIEQNSLLDPRNTKKEMNGCVVIGFNSSYKKYEYNYNEQTCRSLNVNRNLTAADPEYVCYTFSYGTITAYNRANTNCPTDVDIPYQINGIVVRAIGNSAFNQGTVNRYITSVTFPIGLETIGYNAFANNLIKELDLSYLSNLYPINERTFYGNQITEVNFEGLTNLSYIGYEAFADNMIKSVTLKDLTKLNEINSYAFQSNQIESVRIENTPRLGEIYSGAFQSNNINSLILKNLPVFTYINSYAFSNNNIKSLDLSGLSSLSSIGDYAFSDNNITTINFSKTSSLNYIGDSAFASNSLTSVNLPANIKYINYGLFYDNQIRNVVIPARISDIGNDAFENNPIDYITIEGDDIYRFNTSWEAIGFPSDLMPQIQDIAQNVNLTTGVNNFVFADHTYYKVYVPTTGTYKLEVWGAQGGNDPHNPTLSFGGRGGYSTGQLTLNAGTTLYVYVGGQGLGSVESNMGSTGGGGATDIRLVGGNWYNEIGLESRIIVAGGGGGRQSLWSSLGTATYIGNDGGGLQAPSFTIGEEGNLLTITGPSQDSFGFVQYNGESTDEYDEGYFGYAGVYKTDYNRYAIGGYNGGGNGDDDYWNFGGAGGGWYGGVSTYPVGSGGSGFVLTSEYEGGIPISTYWMTNALSTAGNESMPNPDGETMIGRSGNGYARISYIGS